MAAAALIIGCSRRRSKALCTGCNCSPVYYRQLEDWSHVSLSPFSIGAVLSMEALQLQTVCKTMQRARLAPASV